MFFEAAFNGKTQVWRYIVMFFAAFLAANIIGSLPLVIIMVGNLLKDPSLLENSSNNIADLTIYGIEPIPGLVLMLIPFLVSLAAIWLLIKPLNQRTFITIFNGSSSIRWKRLVSGFLVWAVLMGVLTFWSIWSDPENFRINNTTSSIFILAMVSLLLIPFQAAFEEILFRGYLMQGMGVWFRNKWMPLIITSILFALMHSLNPEVSEFGFLTMIPQYIVFGLVFGIVTILDDGIEIAVGAHAANNIFLSIFITSKSAALQTPALYEQQQVYPWSDFIGLVVFSVLFLIILRSVYKWKISSFTWNIHAPAPGGTGDQIP